MSLFAANDYLFEDEITRNPYTLKTWTRYLSFKANAAPKIRFPIYERALRCLPRSYKLWWGYITERLKRIESMPITHKKNEGMISIFERALVHMNKMPTIWEQYCILMVRLKRGTATRKVFDRALQALPITQHDFIWSHYINWAREFGVHETTIRVFRRFLMYDPSQREDFVEYLETEHQYEEAARQLVQCLEDESGGGKTQHELWMRLCEMCSKHPHAVSKVLKVEAIIRSGIARFSDEVGRLWCRLADYFIRLGEFDRARDIFEEAIRVVITVRDFTVVFDAFIKFEESLVTAKMRLEESEEEISFDLARLEYLIDKRPLLLNSVVLRQNPHNVHEWQKRIKLCQGDAKQTVLTYMEAVKTVDSARCVGKLSSLWMGLAHYYEKHGDLENARVVMSQGAEASYRTVEELAGVWCAWAELEIRHLRYQEALQIMSRAVAPPSAASLKKRVAAVEGGVRDELQVHYRLHKSVRVWSLYLDLEESLGTRESCCCAYDRAMELKVVTPLMALNYATYLEEKHFFEDSFRVYERAIVLFEWPHLKPIWSKYLDQFMARYGGSKLERLRDLFEQAVAKVPAEDAAEFYVKYAKAEEQFGLARHAMAVYDRATRVVPDARRLDMYRLYIKKVEEHYGVTRTRPVYERAIQELSDDASRELCLEFSNTERKLGEIDRARAILQHASQFSDPRKHPNYWQHWREFEETHGNEDTFRDMLRVQRSVEAAYSQVNYLAEDLLSAQAQEAEAAEKPSGAVALDAFKLAEIEKEQELKRTAIEQGDEQSMQKKRALMNPEEISLDDDEEEEPVDSMIIRQRPVPSAVYGSVSAP